MRSYLTTSQEVTARPMHRQKGAASYQEVTMRSGSGGEFEETLPVAVSLMYCYHQLM